MAADVTVPVYWTGCSRCRTSWTASAAESLHTEQRFNAGMLSQAVLIVSIVAATLRHDRLLSGRPVLA